MKQDHSSKSQNAAGHMDRLKELERDQLRLTATQTLAEVGLSVCHLLIFIDGHPG